MTDAMTMTQRAGASTADRPTWPSLQDVRGRTREVVEAFRGHFRARGYQEHQPAPLVSHHDPSVRFIGSTVSVIKPLLRSRMIPSSGVFLVQPALRSQNLDLVADDSAQPRWCSYFLAPGLARPACKLQDTAADIWALFRERLPVDPGRVVFRVSSQDVDLRAAIAALQPPPEVEVDGYEEVRYRHRYGMPGVIGRNFNIAVRSSWGELRDLGNLVLMEDRGEAIAVEFGTGVGTLLAWIHDLEHPIQASPIGTLVPIRDWRDVKLADCLAAAVAILEEGVRPNAEQHGRVLRAYLLAISHLRRKASWPLAEIERLVRQFEHMEFHKETDLGGRVRRHLEQYERLAASGRAEPEVNARLSRIWRGWGRC